MARPRKRENQGLPQNLVRRERKLKGKVVNYYYYTLANGKEKPLGKDRYLAILEAARLNFEDSRKFNKLLFIDVAERYKQEVVPLKKSKSTISSNTYALNRLCQFFGNPPIPFEDIEPKHIRLYLQWRKATPASANNDIGLFNHIWNMAREWGYTRFSSPSQGVKKYKVNFREIYVEDYLLEKLYECADERMRDIMDVAYLLGQRPVDVVKIHSTHIYDGILHITQQKTGKKVRFNVTGKLKEIIERRITESNQYLFTNKHGRQLSRTVLSRHFAALRGEAIKRYPQLKEELEQIQIRDLRAKAATDISLSQSDEQARKNLGHSSVTMIRHYIRKDKPLNPTK